VDFGITGQLLIMYSAFIKYLRKNRDAVRREVSYNIFIQFGIPVKLVRIIKMCLNGTYSSVWVGKRLSVMFHIKNGLKRGNALIAITFQVGFRICHEEGSGKPGGLEIELHTSASGLCW
jgi:hypothetical protein